MCGCRTRHSNGARYLQLEDGGFAYTARSQKSALPRSAAAITARVRFDPARQDRLQQGLKYLHANTTPGATRDVYLYYRQYYLATALRDAEDQHFVRWYPPMSEKLIATYTAEGGWDSSLGDGYAAGNSVVALRSPLQRVIRVKNR